MLPYSSISTFIINKSFNLFNMKFQKIEDLRIDHDLTQQQVADYLGCQREVYRRYEKGTRDIPIDFAIKLCDLYKVSLDYLVGRSSKR